MKKLLFITMLSLATQAKEYLLTPSSQPPLISLPEAISLATKNNLALKKINNLSHIAEAKVWQDLSGTLPELSLSASGLNLSAPLFNLKAFIALQASRASAEAARLKLNYESQQLAFNVANLYLEALIAQVIKTIADSERELYKKQLDLITKKSLLGMARTLDIDRADYLYHKSHSEVIIKERDYQRKLGELGESLNRRESFSLTMLRLNSSYLERTPEELIELAQTNNEARSLNKELRAQHLLLVGESLDFLPKISVSFESPYLKTDLKPHNQLMFKLDIPLFTGFSTWGALKSRQALTSSAELALQQNYLDRHLSIYGLLDQITTYQSIEKSSELALVAAKKAAASAERLFSLGHASALELVEANNNLINAQNELSSAQLKLIQNQIHILFLIGKIAEVSEAS